MALLTRPLRTLLALGRLAARLLPSTTGPAVTDPEVARLVRQGDEAYRAGRREEARRAYREAYERRRGDLGALRGLRTLALDAGAWREALALQQRLVALAPPAERAAERATLAGIHYELGRAEQAAGRIAAALTHFRGALRAERGFVPAALALGEAFEAAGDRRRAVLVWERALGVQPTALPLLARLERVHREEGRPARMIALYRAAVERAPEDLALAVALGRVYLELEMLDQAADQLEKIEVRAPDHPVVRAYLGAVFERRGQLGEACAEYRRALRQLGAFEWPHQCAACGATAQGWRDRCAACGRWNSLRPAVGR